MSAHTMNLAVKKGMGGDKEESTTVKILARARKLVGHFHHSTTLTAAL